MWDYNIGDFAELDGGFWELAFFRHSLSNCDSKTAENH